ncbi:Dolichyl-phosphate-mannose-protein mannosyltransferase [uncultured archaeon]|nr:Dolichyl-phosphate-mannose-protein mannosyltransferase [uncultured archaeon]
MNKTTLIVLTIAVLLSLYTHFIVLENFMMPTFGNTNIHVAIARHIIEYGNYPLQDYSYGGTAPNLYVPLYRILLAALVWTSGLSFDTASRLIVIIVTILLPIGFYFLGRKLFGETTGLISAFVASVPPELLYYTVRPLPQAVGMMLLVFALYFLFKNSKWSLLFAFVLALMHQETAAFYGLVCFFYLIYLFYQKTAYHLMLPALILVAVGLNTLSTYYEDGLNILFSTLTIAVLYGLLIETNKFLFKIKMHLLFLKNNFTSIFKKDKKIIVFTGILVAVTYLSWHYFIVGNLRLWELSQFKYSEGTLVDLSVFLRATGLFLTVFTVIGLIFAFIFKKQRLLWLLLLALSFLLIKNDLIGIKAFMDRYIVYVMIFMIPLAAFGIEKLFSLGTKLDKGFKSK